MINKISIYNFINSIKSLVLFYSGWIILHYICSHLYIFFCVPNTWCGILVSPFMTMTPHCTAFRWVIYEAGNIFYTMWIAIGSWIISNLLSRRQINN